MKGCFVLQRRFAYIGHEIAKYLKEKGVAHEFCGYVQVRDGYNFLKTQTEIRYAELILDEDIQKEYKNERLDLEYLRALEKEYGILWRYINVDRIVRNGQLVREYPHDASSYSYDEILRMVQVYAKRITTFLDEQKPDFVYGYVFGSLGTLLLYEMAKKREIPVFTSIVPSTRDLVTVTAAYDRATDVEKCYKEHLSKPLASIPKYQEAREFIDEFRARPSVYTKVVMEREKAGKWQQFAFLQPRNLVWTLYYNGFEMFAEWIRDPEKRTDFSTVNPFLNLYDRVKRKLRNVVGLENLYDEYDPSKRFAFYPLQYEPEASLLLLAAYESDQPNLIARIARSLPAGMYLYVKEHPAMAPYRPRRYYKEIKKIPNVLLINPIVSSFDIIRHAALVTVINGTPGWEAALLGKPVITFGEIFYNALSFIAHSRVPEKLPELIEKQLQRKTDEEELVRFVAALFEDSASLDLMYLWEVERDREKRRAGFKSLAEVLAKKIQRLRV